MCERESVCAFVCERDSGKGRDLFSIEQPHDLRLRSSEGLARESDILSLNDVPALRRPGNDGASCGGRVYECMCVHMFLCVKV